MVFRNEKEVRVSYYKAIYLEKQGVLRGLGDASLEDVPSSMALAFWEGRVRAEPTKHLQEL